MRKFIFIIATMLMFGCTEYEEPGCWVFETKATDKFYFDDSLVYARNRCTQLTLLCYVPEERAIEYADSLTFEKDTVYNCEVYIEELDKYYPYIRAWTRQQCTIISSPN